MGYVVLPRFLFRAPLLPVRALGGARRELIGHPLGPAALALASPALAAALGRAPRAASTAAAVERYARRAAFRATPHGLWAGVGVGRAGTRTRVRTSGPVARLTPSWARLAALGRGLLDRPELRVHTRLRRAPSLTVGARALTWLGWDGEDGFCEQRTADLDDALEAVLRSCSKWADWTAVRGVAAAIMGDDDDGVDDWLLTLVDDGVLAVDAVPPLVGPPAEVWMAERLSRLPGSGELAQQLAAAQAALRAGDLPAAAEALQRLPAGPSQRQGSAIHATLLFPAAAVTLSRAAIGRAAALAPVLFRLQEALAPPAAERTPGAALADTLDAATEIFGAGALDLAALTRGEYGADPAGDPGETEADDVSLDGGAGVVAFLSNRIVAAARARQVELALTSEELIPLLPDEPAPATCELFLTPCRSLPGVAPGAGWLLGVHAPAGASWGRFATALDSEEGRGLFGDLQAGERRSRPDERHLDVAFAPSARTADLCAHPPLRDATLALTDWPAGDHPALTVDDLELVADPAALEALALRAAAAQTDRRPPAPGSGGVAGEVVTPSPLHRVRSTTAPRGIWRLLVGWSLRRQHAPWALAWGPLGALDWTPRVRLDGFVIAPASWRLPPAVAKSARRLGAWRRAHGVPRHVQVGHEDELLPVDLAAPGAAKLLAGHDRVHEIWPPLGDTPDRAGRRIEVVVGLVDEPDPRAPAAARATRLAGAVPPPARATTNEQPPWVTFKLFGAADRQDAVLADVVHPLWTKARKAGWLSGWFFQRYVEGPGRRPHLRLRVSGRVEAVAHALEAQVVEAQRAGDVVAVERAPYFPEMARFGGPDAMSAVHGVFQASSELVLAALLEDSPDDTGREALRAGEDPRLPLSVAAYDALARAAGLDGQRRRALARQRRDAHAAGVDDDFARELAQGFRLARSALRDALGGGGPLGALLAPYQRAATAALADLAPERREAILPALLHLDAVRLMGPDRDAEIRAYTYWERTLESLERHPAARERRAG